MLTINKLYSLLDEYAPFEISQNIINAGGYDNSGIIINSHDYVNKILFSLDLSEAVVNRAKRLGCDTVITHHPAIYRPVSSISADDFSTSSLLKAVQNKMNVISLHLNLDEAKFGIDYYLAQALGCKDAKIIEDNGDGTGYGREFCLNKTSLKELVERVKKNLSTKRVVVYGSPNFEFNKVATFCGGGSSHAHSAVIDGKTSAQVIVTSDMPHHVVKDLIERGKAIVIPTHYASENYGFKKFYNAVTSLLQDSAQTYYFEDKRFL